MEEDGQVKALECEGAMGGKRDFYKEVEDEGVIHKELLTYGEGIVSLITSPEAGYFEGQRRKEDRDRDSQFCLWFSITAVDGLKLRPP